MPFDGLQLQDAATDTCSSIHDLQHRITFVICLLLGMVFWLLFGLSFGKDYLPRVYVNEPLEFAWTLFPIVILWLLAIQSVDVLYALDESYDPELSVAVTGLQWYWTYQYLDWSDKVFESRLLDICDVARKLVNYKAEAVEKLSQVASSYLEVDNALVIPVNTNVRVMVTGNDVIHSWAIPAFGIKADAIPGRINALNLFIHREGTYYGQCSELCGALHGFMPIVVKVVDTDNFLNYINEV